MQRKCKLRLISKFLFLVLVLIGASAVSAGSPTHTVLIRNMQFEPAELVVSVGDTIVWKNEDLVPHSATAKGVFDSGLIEGSKQFKMTVKKKGSFDYVCLYHPTMKALLKAK